uniref:Large ribosomal subunit protein uL6 n=1 Tax=uncultured Chloroflexi bacterium Rifle_16ft_4_minimus_14836 TaxID=1665059 RepID=A0A0H4T0V5_9CHLR|nr:50S ribosomal protein L6, large subunit ribosomal protein L6 [uncultured Chloroflexi bacterium Rifle_16ft_4_minimus_14836]
MSRVGRKPIPIPPGVEVRIEGSHVTVQGPNGTLERTFRPEVSIRREDGILVVERASDERLVRALHGLSRALLANMVTGVASGFQRVLELSGTGYRVQRVGEGVILQIGYSHPVPVTPLPGVVLAVEGTNRIIVSGPDREAVGEVAARIRRIRPPDAYKGKGVRYQGEVLRLKPGKAGAKKR